MNLAKLRSDACTEDANKAVSIAWEKGDAEQLQGSHQKDLQYPEAILHDKSSCAWENAIKTQVLRFTTQNPKSKR